VQIWLHPEAVPELNSLPDDHRFVVNTALAIWRRLGRDLQEPHVSALLWSSELRLLCPDSGRSPWRVFWAPYGRGAIVLCVGPSEQTNSSGYRFAADTALARLRALAL